MIDEEIDFCEESWIIYGLPFKDSLYGISIWESEGSPGNVDFNWQKVFKEHKKIIGFIHTHPSGFFTPSATDDNTMIGWVKAMGKPLLCGIKSEGILVMYLYWREQSNVIYRKIDFEEINDFLIVEVK